MRTYLHLLVLVSAVLGFAGGGRAEPPAGEASDPRFEDVPPQSLATVQQLDTENPKLVATWLKVREIQNRLQELINVFGVQKRKYAEREIQSLNGQLAKETEAFRKLYEKEREPLVSKEASLKDEAFRMSQKPASASEAKQEAEEKKQAEIYEEAGRLGERIRALDALEVMIGKLQLPDRLDQLGIPKHDTALRKQADQYSGILERLLVVKDCLADIQEIKARETAESGTADTRLLDAAQYNLDRATADLEKEAARLKKPIEASLEKSRKQIDTLKAKIDTLAKRKRSTEQYDDPLAELEATLEQQNALIETISKLADWQKLKDDAAKTPAR